MIAATVAEETVARRIVMRSDTWKRLVHIAEVLQATRDVDVDPTEVAVIALEAGLQEVQRGVTGEHPRPTQAPSGNGQPSANGNGASYRARGASTTTRRSRRSTSGPRLRMSDADRAQLASWLRGQGSVRARQRTIALWLGARRRKVHLEALRDLAVANDAYDVANFAQNMKKDGALFTELKNDNGRRIGWRLTRQGHQIARALDEDARENAF
jgi:hypothetical protein